MISFNVKKVVNMPNIDLDLSRELVESAKIIASEIRRNIQDGISFNGVPLKPNAPSTMKRKYNRTTKFYKRKTKEHKAGELRVSGESKPLIDIYKKLVSPTSYKVSKLKRNVALVRMSESIHPDTSISISRLGAIHNFGEGRMPKRPFFGVSASAVVRIVAYIRKRIDDILNSSGPHG